MKALMLVVLAVVSFIPTSNAEEYGLKTYCSVPCTMKGSKAVYYCRGSGDNTGFAMANLTTNLASHPYCRQMDSCASAISADCITGVMPTPYPGGSW